MYTAGADPVQMIDYFKHAYIKNMAAIIKAGNEIKTHKMRKRIKEQLENAILRP